MLNDTLLNKELYISIVLVSQLFYFNSNNNNNQHFIV